MNKQDVYDICKAVAPGFGIDPLLALAICEQESSYNEKAMRLENGFEHTYLEKYMFKDFAQSSKVLMSVSYGLMQIMGESLWEIGLIVNNNAELIRQAIDILANSPRDQVSLGCKWFAKKLSAAGGDVTKALQLWNGGGNPDYATQVLARQERLKSEVI